MVKLNLGLWILLWTTGSQKGWGPLQHLTSHFRSLPHATTAHTENAHTYICNSTHAQVGIRNQVRKGWRAETSRRSAGVRRDSGAGYTPTVWSPSCGAHRWGNHHGSPWKECSAPCDCVAGGSRSTDSTRPGSRWCSRPPCIHPARTCNRESAH